MSAGKTFVRRRGTTPIPNATVHDKRLSYAALGLLTVILARPDSAPQGYRALMGRGLGEKATLEALRELNDAGYRHQVKRTTARGRIVTDTVVSEEPISHSVAAAWLASETEQPTLDEAVTVQQQVPHGVTSTNAASSQVAPRSARPRHGRALRTPTGSNGPLRGPSDPPPIACDHGEPRGARYCPFCRREGRHLAVVPTPTTTDPRALAAGEHLEA